MHVRVCAKGGRTEEPELELVLAMAASATTSMAERTKAVPRARGEEKKVCPRADAHPVAGEERICDGGRRTMTRCFVSVRSSTKKFSID